MTTLWAKLLAVVVALGLVGTTAFYLSVKQAQAPDGVACTAEAMQCPDGTWVGRTGPHCEFICPAASSTTDSTSTGSGPSGGGFAEYRSGIKGTVLAGPTCPVERDPPDPACADRPLQITILVSRKSDPGRTVATAQSDAQGAFQISLPPGEYAVEAKSSGMLPRCSPVPAAVLPTGYTTVAISCDTGIR